MINELCGYKIKQYETATGKWLLPEGPDTDVVINSIKAGGIFDWWVYEQAKRFIKPGTLAIDVGSNFGQMAVLFSRLVGQDGYVQAYECHPDYASIIRQNLALNNAINVSVIEMAAYDQGNLTIPFQNVDFKLYGTFGSYGLDPKLLTSEVFCTTVKIDTICAVDQRPITFLKVDAQGSDLLVLRGATQTILKNKMPIVFESEDKYDERFGIDWGQYERFIDEIGYRVESSYDFNRLIVSK